MDCHEQQVDPQDWHSRCTRLAAQGASMLDFLTAVDHPAADRIDVVVHLVDVDRRTRYLLTTRADRADPHVDSLVDVLAGAAWHEREVHEMFGVAFDGNPDLRPLLTTPGTATDVGTAPPSAWPLRRSTPLPARVATPWPGATEPAPRDSGGRVAAKPRGRQAPPGIPAEWR